MRARQRLKKSLVFLMLFLLVFSTNSFSVISIAEGTTGTDLPDNIVRIHYEKEDGNYEGWATWVWGDVATPSEAIAGWPDGAYEYTGIDEHGAYYDIEIKEDAQSMGFLFVNKSDGSQTGDMSFELLAQYNEIFVKDGDGTVYTNPEGVIPVALISAELLSDTKIELRFSANEGLNEERLLESITVKGQDENLVEVTEVVIAEKTVELVGDFGLDNSPYRISFEERTVTASVGWRMIDEMYAYDGKLGAELHEDGTATLKLWSPKAENVSVVLYDKDDQNEVVTENIEMTLGDRGVWSVTLSEENTGVESVRGYYYHYLIQHPGEADRKSVV